MPRTQYNVTHSDPVGFKILGDWITSAQHYTGANNHQDTFKTHSFKPLAEVVWIAFNHVSFEV